VLDLELQRRRERRRKGNEVLELFSLRPTVAAELSICLRWKFEDPVAKAPLETNVAEDPIVSIAPKKPNSDLRRDVAKKLERRTQRAIIELM
jgi:ribosomal protein S12